LDRNFCFFAGALSFSMTFMHRLWTCHWGEKIQCALLQFKQNMFLRTEMGYYELLWLGFVLEMPDVVCLLLLITRFFFSFNWCPRVECFNTIDYTVSHKHARHTEQSSINSASLQNVHRQWGHTTWILSGE
jgi:hypothetical protein